MDRLDVLAQNTLLLNPKPLVIYKPNNRDIIKGGALKLGYRVERAVREDGTPAPFFTGGCFLETAQEIQSDNQYPKFDWREGTLTAKLGLPDLSAMLLSYRTVRHFGGLVPEKLRPMNKDASGKWVPDPTGMAVSLIHKSQTNTEAPATVIKWIFDTTRGSLVEISKGKNARKTVSLSPTEELQFARYLELAMDALLLSNV